MVCSVPLSVSCRRKLLVKPPAQIFASSTWWLKSHSPSCSESSVASRVNLLPCVDPRVRQRCQQATGAAAVTNTNNFYSSNRNNTHTYNFTTCNQLHFQQQPATPTPFPATSTNNFCNRRPHQLQESTNPGTNPTPGNIPPFEVVDGCVCVCESQHNNTTFTAANRNIRMGGTTRR